jgi:hypothetical protein
MEDHEAVGVAACEEVAAERPVAVGVRIIAAVP